MNLNEDVIKSVKERINGDTKVVTFSHFLPRRELLPPRDKLLIKYLPKFVGALRLDQQLRSVGSSIHIYGHTHIDGDISIDGVRYVQQALSYPQERAGWKAKYITLPYLPKLL